MLFNDRYNNDQFWSSGYVNDNKLKRFLANIEIIERPLASGLTLDDLQGVFYLAGLMICVGFVAFSFENAMAYLKQRDRNITN